MEILFAVGQFLFGGFFVLNAINHFKNAEGMAAYAKSKKVPFPKMMVISSGLLLLLGGLGILLGSFVGLAVFFLILFLVPVSFQMHNFWDMSDPNVKAMEKTNFLKNIALAGAALMVAFIPEQLWAIQIF